MRARRAPAHGRRVGKQVGAAEGRGTSESPYPRGVLASNICQLQREVPASQTRREATLGEMAEATGVLSSGTPVMAPVCLSGGSPPLKDNASSSFTPTQTVPSKQGILCQGARAWPQNPPQHCPPRRFYRLVGAGPQGTTACHVGLKFPSLPEKA